ncbi:MAG TPA: hypothetical protein VHB69_10100 [Mycobacteriales bacterium]|nr:hypothetical protein [Mycobacteriales bacterium]
MTDHPIPRSDTDDATRRRGLLWLWLAVVAVLLAGLVAAIVRLNGCGQTTCGAGAANADRTGRTSNSTTGAASVPVTVSVTGTERGDLAPGTTRPVVVSVANTGRRPARIISAGVTVGNASRACRAAAVIRVTGYNASAPGAARYVLAPGAVARIPLRIAMLDLPTNQNACENASFPLTFHATARQG